MKKVFSRPNQNRPGKTGCRLLAKMVQVSEKHDSKGATSLRHLFCLCPGKQIPFLTKPNGYNQKEELIGEKRKSSMEEDHRPWGYYRVLSDETDHKVKRIVVYPGKRLSLQRHRLRAEHWFIVSGEALVIRDREQIPLSRGEAVDIPKGALHRIENTKSEPVVFIEVQTGTYFGQDDIERIEDDFGRL